MLDDVCSITLIVCAQISLSSFCTTRIKNVSNKQRTYVYKNFMYLGYITFVQISLGGVILYVLFSTAELLTFEPRHNQYKQGLLSAFSQVSASIIPFVATSLLLAP